MEHYIPYRNYMPHGMCLLWEPWLVSLWVGSNLLIFLSYMAIPIALLSVLRSRSDVPHRGLVMLFAAFIVLCGFTHMLEIVTLWFPIYPWVGSVKLLTGLVSMVTAVVLFRLIPTLIALPSPAALAGLNASLEQEIAAHTSTLASLELQVAARTSELQKANMELAVRTQEALHRTGNLLSVVSAIATQSSRGDETKDQFVETLLGRFRALAKATTALREVDGKASESLHTLLQDQLEPLLQTFPERVSLEGPELDIGARAAQQLCLVVHELATNAQKYSLALSRDALVMIDWEIQNENGESRFILRWRERLGGQITTAQLDAKRGGFGSRLLMRIVPMTLNGEAQRDIEDGMLRYTLWVPLAALRPDTNGQGEAVFSD